MRASAVELQLTERLHRLLHCAALSTQLLQTRDELRQPSGQLRGADLFQVRQHRLNADHPQRLEMLRIADQPADLITALYKYPAELLRDLSVSTSNHHSHTRSV